VRFKDSVNCNLERWLAGSGRLFAVCALAAAAGCAPTPKGSDELLIVAGQSNALGFRLEAVDLPAGLRRPHPRVKIWDGEAFVTLEPGVNTGSPNNPRSWGPETAFAHAWLRDHPGRTLFVVKRARGSTPLAPSPGPDWAPASGELFSETTAEVRRARAWLAHRGVVPAAATILWMQGESDAARADAAAAYRANLAAALPQMRARWGDPDSRIAFGRIGLGWPYAGMVRAAQARVDAADPLAVAVDTAAYPLLRDGRHYAAEGQLRLGADLYAALKN
jgi:hypothetical protein